MTEHRFRSMGTDVVVLAPTDRPDAADRVRGVFTAWDERFSRFRPDSELSHISAAAGSAVAASDEMRAALHAALDAARASDGIFDPLVGHRMAALGYDRTFEALPLDPPPTPLGPWQAGAWRRIEIDDTAGTICLPAGSGLDLGGIAKGMAVDAAIAELAAAGCGFGAVNAGGDLRVLGSPPHADGWTVLLDDVGEQVVTLHAGALATSSVRQRRWTVGGEVRHHLLDPVTGLPSTSDVLTASVVAPTCRRAEVAAKTALLLGPEHGAAFLASHDLAGLLVTRDGSAWRVGAWSAGP
jgi:thiamine biosynthesis lipoprotein